MVMREGLKTLIRLISTVLKNNPDDDYALKGIAWIAFSNDNNTIDSKNIMNTLASRKRMPEAYLHAGRNR